MSEPIRFFYRGQVHTVSDASPTQTILQQVREHQHCSGTKEGCAEGDCGACTVVVGELRPGGGIDYRAVNSCIRFLPTFDGREVVTVESLRDPKAHAGEQGEEGLHPVQRAMVDCHASQCG